MTQIGSDFPIRNVLVTGGAGFLGAHLLRAMLIEPAFAETKISVLDDLSGGFKDNIPSDHRIGFIEGSVADDCLIDSLFDKNKFDLVYHLAAYAAEGLSHFIRRYNYTNNVLGSVNLINAAVRNAAKGFVFTSSIAVYGEQRPPMRESVKPTPADPYGIAKYAVEMDLQAAHEMFGLPFVIVRPHNVYGEFQNTGDPYRNVVGIFMRALLEDRPMPIFGDGLQTRAFTYAGDIARAMVVAPLLSEAKNRVFNLGSDAVTSVIDLAADVATTMRKPCRVEHLPNRLEVKTAFADHSLSHQVFGDLLGDTSLPDGLAKMAKWVLQVGVRRSTPYREIEILDKLPPSWRKLLFE